MGFAIKDLTLYDGLCELVRERYLLPKLRKVKIKKRKLHDIGKIREAIEQEVLADGVQKFPEGFVERFEKVKVTEIGLPAGRLKLGENFWGKQELCSEDGAHVREEPSIERAKFILYAKGKDALVVKVPESEIVIKKAVQEYGFYLKDLQEKLYRAFMEQCGDHTLSENLTKQVFEDYGLPDIG